MLDVNIIIPPILAFLGIGLFLALPIKIRWLIHKYAPDQYRNGLFYGQYLLSLLPIVEWAMLLVWTQPKIRAAIIGVITACFVFYLILVSLDIRIMHSLNHNNSIKELKNMVTIGYMMRSFYILLALLNILLAMDSLHWAPPVGSAARQWLVSWLYIIAFVLNSVIILIESQLSSRRQKHTELAQVQSKDIQQKK